LNRLVKVAQARCGFSVVATDIEDYVAPDALNRCRATGLNGWPNARRLERAVGRFGISTRYEQKALREGRVPPLTDLPQDLSGRQAAPTRAMDGNGIAG